LGHDSPVADLIASLAAPIAGVAASLGDGLAPDVDLERPADATHGDYATTIALRLARQLKRPPRDIAADLAGRIASDDVESVEVAGPGFLNLWLSPAWYRKALVRILAEGDRYGAGRPAQVQRLLVEFVSANPTGDLTVGSGRNAAYGDSVARLLEFAGHEVTREYYFNDAGRQVELFGESLRARRLGQEPPEGGYPGAEIAEVAAELPLADDAPLEDWARVGTEHMIARIRHSLERIRVDMDIWFSETELHASGSVERGIERARAAGYVEEHDGATWLKTTEFGDDKDRVVLRSDGGPTYLAADLAYVEHKIGRGHERLLYVLGADHHGYIKRLQATAGVLGHDPEIVEVLLYQMITVSGERMGKRRGNVVSIDELVDAIGVDASRYFLVARSHDQPMDIDVDLAVEQSSKNPVYYVQYAHARIRSILRKELAQGEQVAPDAAGYEPQRQEREVIKRLAEWPSVVQEAADRRAPHRVVAWVHDLAADFHVVHHDLLVLDPDPAVRGFRLALARATGDTIRSALALIGVEAPDAMHRDPGPDADLAT
jgi:arginyl-tRNA synthetase